MTRYLVFYHLEKLIVWFLATPVVTGLLVLPFSLFQNDVTIWLFPVLVAITFVLTMFLEQTNIYQKMLHVMPIPPRTFVHVKFLFSALIIAYPFTLLAVFVSNQVDVLLPFLLSALALCIFFVNVMLFYHFFTGQQKHMVIILVIFILLPLNDFQPFHALLISNKTSMILLPITLIITSVNYCLCLYFAKTKDA